MRNEIIESNDSRNTIDHISEERAALYHKESENNFEDHNFKLESIPKFYKIMSISNAINALIEKNIKFKMEGFPISQKDAINYIRNGVGILSIKENSNNSPDDYDFEFEPVYYEKVWKTERKLPRFNHNNLVYH